MCNPFEVRENLDDLFSDPNRRFDERIPPCACGSPVITRYHNSTVWIECKDLRCKKHSAPKNWFPDTLNDWVYQLERS